MDTDGEEKYIIRNDKVVFPTGGYEVTNLEMMESFNASKQSWDTEEEDNTPFTYWKGIDEYRDPIDSTSLTANFCGCVLGGGNNPKLLCRMESDTQ